MRSPLSGRARTDVVAVPASGRLAEGAVVEGRVLVRLLGFKLLRVTAEVMLVPANLTASEQRARRRTPHVADRRRADSSDTGPPALSASARGGRPTLEAAQRLLRDTDALLNGARRSS